MSLWSSGRALYADDLHLVYALRLNLEVLSGVSLQRAPASIIFHSFRQIFDVLGLARLPAGAFSSRVGSGLVNFVSAGFPSPEKSVVCCIAFIKLVPWRVPRSDCFCYILFGCCGRWLY